MRRLGAPWSGAPASSILTHSYARWKQATVSRRVNTAHSRVHLEHSKVEGRVVALVARVEVRARVQTHGQHFRLRAALWPRERAARAQRSYAIEVARPMRRRIAELVLARSWGEHAAARGRAHLLLGFAGLLQPTRQAARLHTRE